VPIAITCLLPGHELGEGPAEHQVVEVRVGPGVGTEGSAEGDEIGQRVIGPFQRGDPPGEAPEALPEHLLDQPPLVAEEAVDGGGRGLRPLREAADGQR